MLSEKLKKTIKSYKDFPSKGIFFRDLLPVLQNPVLFEELIDSMISHKMWREVDALVAIDARGFIFGSCMSLKLQKPLIMARKPGKLPGELIEKKYELEYGTNQLSIQKEALENYNNFGIVDDLLATGGTVKCIEEIIKSFNRKVILLSVVVELKGLNGRDKFDFEIDSKLKY